MIKPKEYCKLFNHLQKLQDGGQSVAIRHNEENTGVAHNPKREEGPVKEWVDLGGRKITITIEVGNRDINEVTG